MTGLRPILRLLSLAWWKWALAELSARDPMHEDIPYIVHRINELERA